MSDNYYASGKTELSKATSLLHVNVSKFIISQSNGRVKFNNEEVPSMEGYIPFSEDVDVEGRIEQFCGTQHIDTYCTKVNRKMNT